MSFFSSGKKFKKKVQKKKNQLSLSLSLTSTAAAPPAPRHHGNHAVRLRQTGQRRVLNQHGRFGVAAEPREILNARIRLGRRRRAAEEPMRRRGHRARTVAGLERLCDGSGVVFEAGWIRVFLKFSLKKGGEERESEFFVSFFFDSSNLEIEKKKKPLTCKQHHLRKLRKHC